MPTDIEKDAYRVLEFAVKRQDEARAAGVDQVDEYFGGQDIEDATLLPSDRINDAVALLRQNGFIEGFDTFGVHPFDFGTIHATAFGRFELQRLATATEKTPQPGTPTLDRLPVPIGSPFGFTDIDWEHVSTERGKTDQLSVVLGYQFESAHYDSELLRENLRGHFQAALDQYIATAGTDVELALVFEPLSAGLGEHLFNEIVRAIISSDVAVFETSDLNPNVMIEMGVALTWGTRVLPIKKHGCARPPSDISGQTWADYIESAARFAGDDFPAKVMALIERAHRKKVSRAGAAST
jgi:hypothetical protein